METQSGATVSLLSEIESIGSTAMPLELESNSMMWTLIFGFIIAFVLAFAVGANDVANSFGTTVGANVLTLRSACILASIFETMGAILLGARVGETIRKGIIDVSIYNETDYGRDLLMIGEVSAMSGAAIWQLIATALGLPVSGTHSIVGACIGFSLVAVGSAGVNWRMLGFIVASWFVSPVLSGFMAVTLYLFVNRFILQKSDPLKHGLHLLPFFYAFTFGINGFSILFSGAPLLGLDNLPLWAIFLITFVIMLITGLIVYFLVVPRLRVKAEKDMGMHAHAHIPDFRDEEEKCKLKKCSRSDSCRLNDSGYQTPKDSRKMNAVLDFPVAVDEEDPFAGNSATNESLLQYEREIELTSTVQKSNAGSKVEKHQSKQLKRDRENADSSSYDGGDSDSAYEESTATSPSARVRCSIHKKEDNSESIEEKLSDSEFDEEDPPSVRRLFSFLQILTACFGSFAHGGNDVSNAIGPLIALWLIYHSGNVVQKAATPWYLLLYGGAGIVAGLWILGRRVIQTIGKDLTKITPSRGFCIELMTALTVLIASNIGIPVSTTHCKVGSVVSIGWFRSRSAVKWSMVRNIALAWFVTVPVSGLISAGVMYLLMNVAL